MRNSVAAVLFALLLAGISQGAEPGQVAMVAGSTRPNFLVIDKIVVNLNAVASMTYQRTQQGDAGDLVITYLTGQTQNYRIKSFSDAEWTTVLTQVVSVGNKPN